MLAATALLLATHAVHAQSTYFWRSEAGDGNWQQAGNTQWWEAGNNTSGFAFGIQWWDNNHFTTQTNNTASASTHAFHFASGASTAHTFVGSSVRLFDSGGNDPYIRNASGATHVFNFALEGDGNSEDPLHLYLDSTGGLTFNGNITNNGSGINIEGSNTGDAKTVTFAGVISGTGGMYLSNASVTTVFDNTHTLSGNLTINGGTARLQGAGDTFGASTQNIRIGTGATLDLNGVSTTVGSVAEEGSSDSGSIALGAGTLTVTADSTGSQLYQGSISGSGGLTKQGSHTLNLFDTQSYTGTTTVSDGQLSTSVAMSSTNFTINGGTFTTDTANRLADTAAVSVSSGTFTVGGDDTVGAFTITGGTLGGSSTLTASTYTLSGGTLTGNLGSGTATASTGTTALNGTLGANLTVSGGTVNLGSADRISDSASVTVSSGTLGMDANDDTVSAFTLSGGTLGGSGTLTATTYTLSGGTLTANLGGGTATASTGTTALNGTLGANLTVSGGTVNLGSADRISDSATVAVSSGTLGMDANNDTVSAFTLSGGTLGGSGTLTASTYTLSGGTLTANLGSGTATASTGTTSLNGTLGASLTVNGGTVNLGSDDRIGDSSTVAISSGTLGISTFSDTVSTFTISSTGTLDGSTGVLTAGSYALEGGTINAGLGTGAITVTTATTTLGSANRLNSASTLTINSGQLSLGGAETVASLAGSGGTLALDGNTISVGGGDTSTSFAGAITGTGGGLTKTGTGTLTLSGNSSYTGATTLSGGGLVINGTNTSTAVTVGNDTILGGSGSLGAVTIEAGGRIAPGNSPGTLSVSSLTLEAGSGYNWELDNVTGTAGTNWDLISVGGGTGTVTINATSGSPHTIYISGAATGFTNTGSYSWTIIDAGTLSGFDANDFGVNFTTLNGQTPTGTFSFSNVSGDLILAYAAAASVYDVTVAADTAANQGSAQATNSVAQFTGASALNKLGAGTLIMTNSANDYTGVTTINEGTLQINVAAPNASAGALGNASSAVVVGDAAAAAAAGFNFGEAVTNARGLSIVAGTGAADRIISTTFGSGTAAQSGTVVMNTNTTFSIASGGTLNVSGVVSGAGTLTKVGAGTLTLSANNTYTGNTVVGVGTLALGAANRIADSSNLTVSNSATFALNNFAESLGSISGGGTISLGSATLTSTTTANTTFSGDITGTGGLVKAGSGTLTLSGSNSYSGTTAVNAGGVVVGDNNAFGSGTVSLADGTTLSSDASARTLSNNMNIRRIAFEGTGALTLNGNLTNNRGAAITVTNSVAGGLTMSNLALSHTTTGRDVTLAGSGNTTVNGVISDGGAGATSEFLIENTGTTTLNGANTFSGGFTLSAGTLVIGNNAALGSGSVTFDDGVTVNSDATARNVANDIDFRNLQIGGTGALTLSGTLTHTRAGGSTLTNNNAAGLTLGNINLASSSVNREVTFAGTGDTAVTGVIANGGTATASSIVLNATGTTLTLSGANTYGGDTTITAGTLLAANDTALGADTTGTTVADGATLAFSNNVNSAEAITISGNGVLSGGALRNVSGNNTNTGNVVLGATSKIQIDSGSSLTLSNVDTTFGTRSLVVSANGTLTVLGAISNSTAITNVLQKDGLGNMIVSNNGTTGGIQLQLGAGAFTLASGSFSTNTSTTGSAASPRAIDLGISASGDSTNDVAFYANGGVTVSNSIYVAPSGSGSSATRTLGTESTSGTATFDNEIYLGGNLNVSAASGGTALFSGNIVNNGNLTKTNTGTVVLAGANTFGGAVAVDEGTLVVSNSAAINDTNAVTIASGATLSLGSSETVGSITSGGNIALLGNQLIAGGNGTSTEFSGVMSSSSDAASFVKTGAGTLTLSGANTMNGQLYLVNGTTLFTANQGSGFTNTINIGETNGAAAATLAFGGSGLSVTNPINVRSGNDGLMTIEAQNSTGTLALEGNLTLSKNATLKATNGGEVLLSGAVDIGASQLFTENTSGSDITISGNISADAARTGELLLDDTGTVFLTGNNSANMKVTLSQGTLVVGNITNLGDPSGTFFGSKLNLNGGTLSATNDVTAGANFGVTVSANGGNLLASSGKTLKFVDFINDTGAGTAAYTLGIGGGGTVIFEKASGNNQFNSNMTFSVTNGSTLSTPNLLALGSSSTNIISLNNGTFAYTGNTGTASQRFTMGASGGTVNVSSSSQTLSVTNAMTFTGALTKTGDGILSINNANTGTGGATVSSGVLSIGNASSLGTGGTVTVNSGATLQITNGVDFGRNTTLSGNGTVSGALLSAGGANTNSGIITLSNGGARIGVSSGSLLVSGGVNGNGGANRLTLDTYGVAGTPLTISAAYTNGSGGLTKIGGGTAVLSGANTYSGGTEITTGTLQVGAGGTSGQLGSGDVTNNATLNFNRSDAIAVNNAISGTGALIKSGASTLTLGGANTYSGGTLISAGTLAGTTGSIQGNVTNSGALIFDQSTTGTYAGIISGTGTLAMTNSGTVSLTGANTFSGGVTVNQGTLVLDRTGGPALGGANAITINNGGILRTDQAGQITGGPLVTVESGGTYNLNNNNQTNALDGAGNVSLGSATLSISNTFNDTFSGVISGSGGLTKVGSGAQTLSGSNTYTGATTITEGELALGADDVIDDASAVTVNGGTFDLGARAETLHSISMSSGDLQRGGGILALDNASSFTGGTVTLSAGASEIETAGTTTLGDVSFNYSSGSGNNNALVLGGGLSVNASTTANITNGGGGAVRLNLNDAVRTFEVGSSGHLNLDWVVWSSANSSGGITKTGAGTLTLGQANLFTGGFTVSDGVVRAGNDEALGGSGGAVDLNGGTVASTDGTARAFGNDLSIGGDVTFGQATGGTGALTFSSTATNNLGGATRTLTTVVDTKIDGAIGNGGVSKAGAGTLSLSNASSSFGSLAISAGRVDFQTNATVTGLSGSGGDLAISGGTLTVNASTNSSFGQAITGAGALSKSGVGTLTLTASNNFDGATTISGGSLVVNGTNTGSAVSIGSTGTLGGTGSVGATTVQSGGFISPGNSIGTLSVDTLTLEGGGGYVWEVADVTGSAGTDYDLISVGGGAGSATVTATTGSPFTIYLTSYTGFTNWNSSSNYSWNIIDWGSVSGFTNSAFTVNTNDFTGTISGAFTFANTNGYLVMSYEAGIPTYDTNSGTWSGGFVPALANGNSILFDGPGGNATNDISSATVANIGNITFSNTAGSYTLSADSGSAGFDSASALVVNGSIVNNSSNAQTINLALGFDAEQTIEAAGGDMTFGGAISNGTGLIFTGASNNTVSGVVSGAGTVAKTGTGTLFLDGANTYTGATTISNGVVQLGNAAGLGATNGGTTVVSGATLDLNGQTVGNEALSLAGTGVGGNGALINSSASAASLSGAITLTGNTTIGTTGDMTLTGVMGGGFSLTKTGAATLTLDAVNTYSGGTVVNAGVVFADNDSGFGSGSITVNGGGIGSTGSRTIANNIVAGGDFFMGGSSTVYNGTFDLGGATRTITFSNKATLNGIISNGGLTISAGGIATDIVMDGVNTYTGPTTINGGELILTNDGSLSTSTAVDLTGSAGTAALDIEFISGESTTIGSLAASNNASTTTVTLGTKTLVAGGNNDNTIFNGSMEGTGGFTKAGTGTMTVGAANSYTGATTISNGEIALSGSGRLADTTAVNLAGATARYDISAKDATTETNGSLAGVAGSIVNLGGKTLNVGGNDASTTFAGVISNTGSLIKSGTGTMTLSGANTFSGGSTLSAGVLRVDNTSGLGTGTLVQSDGTSTLQINAGGTIANNLSVYSVQFLNGGNTLSGTITNNNTVYDVASGTTNTVSGFVTGSGGVELIGGGQLNLTGTTNNYTGNTVISNGTLQISTLANSNTVSSIGVSNNITLAGADATNAVLDYTGGNVTTDRTFVLNDGGGTINLATATTTNTLTGSASGTGTLIVGEGTLVLSNGSTSNSFAPGAIQVDSGATLELAANNQIGDSTGLILNGGTFRVGTATTGFSDTLGTLTLSASSTIDLGAWTTGVRQLTFANSSAITWTGTLTITNWQGVANTSSDVAEILFGTGGLSSGQLAQVYWGNQDLTGGTLIGGNGELVPVPEPRVYAAAVALLAVVGWRERKRLLGLIQRTKKS